MGLETLMAEYGKSANEILNDWTLEQIYLALEMMMERKRSFWAMIASAVTPLAKSGDNGTAPSRVEIPFESLVTKINQEL